MKSVKPGRAPSFMGGVMSIFAGLFGVVWTILAVYTGGGFFALFGLFFIAIAVVQAVYHFKNATGKTRYSSFDVVDDSEEPDPLNRRFGAPSDPWDAEDMSDVPDDWDRPAGPDGRNARNKTRNDGFCPYCGAPVGEDFSFCSRCGKKLP